MDEDSPKWPSVSQSDVDWSSQCCLESRAPDVAGCKWHYTLLLVQSWNDDDDDDDDTSFKEEMFALCWFVSLSVKLCL